MVYMVQSITILYFSHQVNLLALIGIHHLIVFPRNETKAFLVAAPDLNAFAVVPALLVLHVCGLTLLAPALLHLLHPNDTFFKRECRGGDSNPQPLEWQSSTLTVRPCHSPHYFKLN